MGCVFWATMFRLVEMDAKRKTTGGPYILTHSQLCFPFWTLVLEAAHDFVALIVTTSYG